MRKTRFAVQQPELHPVIEFLESFIPEKELRDLRNEADEKEYSDWEYKEALESYWEENISQRIYCSCCGKRLTWKEVEDGLMFVGKPVCEKHLKRLRIGSYGKSNKHEAGGQRDHPLRRWGADAHLARRRHLL